MIPLRLFLLVLSTLVCREWMSSQPESDFFHSALAVLGATLGFGLLGKCSALAAASYGASHRHDDSHFLPTMQEQFAVKRRTIEWIWTACLPLLLWLTGWVQWTNSISANDGSACLSLALLFLPSVVFLALIELSAAQLDALHAEWTKTSEADPQATTAFHFWRLRLRLGEFASFAMSLFPVVTIALLHDIITHAGWVVSEVQMGLLSLLFAALLLAFLYPLALGRWMGVQSLGDPVLVARIDAFRRAAGLRHLRAVEVPSDGRWNGAAIVGWIPGFRSLWIGDALMRRLSERELDMVILHEIAHVRRFHFIWRILPIAGAISWGVAWMMVENVIGGGSTQTQGTVLIWIGHAINLLVATGILIVGIGILSRFCELDADRQACYMAESMCDWAVEKPGLPAAELASALTAILGGSREVSRKTWLHPSLKERLLSLSQELKRRQTVAIDAEPS